MKTQWMIYGANGYSAQLAAKKAVELGLRPILAGRNKEAIEAVANPLSLESRIFNLDDVNAISGQLKDIKVLSHCAGPFSATALAMMKACIESGTHYTDITGEIEVFDSAQQLDLAAKQKKIVLCSGVGFDVIPTDCLANYLSSKMPDATDLTMGFHGNMSLSPGTAKTMVESLSEGMKVRRDGKLKTVGRGFEMRTIDYGKGKRLSAVIPWGDLSTAFWQTGIPNISIYTPFNKSKLAVYLFPLIKLVMKLKLLQKFVKNKIDKNVIGPSEKMRQQGDTFVWGEVKNKNSETLAARIQVPNGYTVTMDGIIITAQFLLNYKGKGGCFTPSQLMGKELIHHLPDASEFKIVG